MTTAALPRIRRRSALDRIRSIARAEAILYLRKPLFLLPALLMGPAMALLLGPTMGKALEGAAFSAFLVEMLSSWALLMVAYYTLTMIAVTRRNEGVYQRMATGRASSWEAFIAGCAPVDEIAERVHLSPGTVRNYLSSAMTKLDAPNRHAATEIAARRGGSDRSQER